MVRTTQLHGHETVDEELRDRPALHGRKNMKGVGVHKTPSGSDPEDDESSAKSSSENELSKLISASGRQTRASKMAATKTLTGTAAKGKARNRKASNHLDPSQFKKKKIPAHLLMSSDSGTESEPEILAPGWNISLMPNRGDAQKIRKDNELLEQGNASHSHTGAQKSAIKTSQHQKATKDNASAGKEDGNEKSAYHQKPSADAAHPDKHAAKIETDEKTTRRQKPLPNSVIAARRRDGKAQGLIAERKG